jgi:hypothetical protein
MMDTLSLAASVIATITALTSLGQAIHMLLGQAEIAATGANALLNEISDLTLILQSISESSKGISNGLHRDDGGSLAQTTGEIQRTLRSLESLKHKLPQTTGNSKNKFRLMSKIRWIKAVEKTSEELRQTRHNLTATLAVLASQDLALRLEVLSQVAAQSHGRLMAQNSISECAQWATMPQLRLSRRHDIDHSEPSQHTKPDFLQTPIGAGSQFDRTTLEQTLP